MKKSPIVCYLYTCFDEIISIKNFKDNYLKFSSGLPHDLIICFKLLKQTEIDKIVQDLDNLEFYIFHDQSIKNDYDFGSYKRVSEKYKDRDILFLNSHSYPTCNNWLKKLMKYKNENTLIGTSASYESIFDSISLKKKYKFFSYLLRIYKFKKHFSKFPNPHIRTSSFLIRGNLFLEYMGNKDIKNKEDTWIIESGKKSLTNFFKKRNFDIFVINSDGKNFTEDEWKNSETYNYLQQTKTIISDKHSRKYLKLSEIEKKNSQLKSWGS